jgi:hypothetical protein
VNFGRFRHCQNAGAVGQLIREIVVVAPSIFFELGNLFRLGFLKVTNLWLSQRGNRNGLLIVIKLHRFQRRFRFHRFPHHLQQAFRRLFHLPSGVCSKKAEVAMTDAVADFRLESNSNPIRLVFKTCLWHDRAVIYLLAALLLGGAVSSRTEVVWDSLSQPVGPHAPFSVTEWRATAFRVTGSQSLFLDSITFNFDGDVAGFANVRLFSDAASKPSTPLGRISDIQLSATASGNFTVPSDTEFTFTPNTTYWVVTRMRPSTGSAFMGTRTGFTETPINGSGLTFVGSQLSVNSGSSWQNWGETPAMNFNVTAVPEPSAISLFICGSVGIFLLAKHPRPNAGKQPIRD